MAHSHARGENIVVLVGEQNGLTVIPTPTPLTSLNYFDGKFLRADDLMVEKRYVRRLVELSNQAGGAGVVHGFDTTLGSGDSLSIGPGMAIDPAGRALLLPTQTELDVADLIEAGRRVSSPRVSPVRPVALPASGAIRVASAAALRVARAPSRGPGFEDCEEVSVTPPSDLARASDLYLVTIAHAEALCGHEDVYGKLCEEACVTSTDRPLRVEGIVVRAVPLTLTTPLAVSSAIAIDRRHLRSRVASAYFADDALRLASLISRAGLAADTWCLGARLDGGSDVPIAVIARSGESTVFLDPWIARRERIEAPARRYWARRMAMRPWDIYLAQILQFQCQLHELLLGGGEPGADDDPCRPQQDVIVEAAKVLEDVETHYATFLEASVKPSLAAAGPELSMGRLPGGLARIASLRTRLQAALEGVFAAPRDRVLIQRGIVELPPAGYLPVVPGSGVSVNDQVRRLVGEGIDLRFCVVRPDFVPHALEEAQHMERISLLHGLDHPNDRPRVDVLVPNGEISQISTVPAGRGFAVKVRLAFGGATAEPLPLTPPIGLMASRIGPAPQPSGIAITGAGRAEITQSGGMAFHIAAATEAPRPVRVQDLVRAMTGLPVEGEAPSAVLARVPTSPDAEHVLIHEDPRFAGRMRSLAGLATDFISAARVASASFTPEAAAPQPAERFAPALAPGERRVVALWASMRTEADVRSMSAGESTGVRFQAVLFSPSASPTYSQLELFGALRIDQVQPTPSGRSISGTFSGTSKTRQVVDGGAPSDEASGHDLNVNLQLAAPAGQPATMTLKLGRPGGAFLIEASWTLAPISVTVRASSVFRERTLEILEAEAVENADVLVPGNSLHTLALSAIEVIGAGLGDPSFRDAAINDLFPAPPPPTKDLLVRATMDWVLFHRRRDITCGIETEHPVVAPPRRYALFQRRVADLAEADAIRKVILEGDAQRLARLELRQVDIVEFAGGQAALSTPADAIRSDWTASGPGELIQYAVIASPPPDDGDVLARARLGRLVDALGPVTPADTSAMSEAIASVPAALSIPGTDGAIVILTRSLATTCVQVFRVDPKDKADSYVVVVDGSEVDVVVGGHSTTMPLGQAVFVADQAQLRSRGDEIRTAWDAVGQGVAFEVVIVSGKGDDDRAGSRELRQRRAERLLALVGVNEGTVDVQEIETPLKGDCPAAAFIVTRPPEVVPTPVATECQRVYRSSNPDFIGKLLHVPTAEEAQAMLGGPDSQATFLGLAQFVAGDPSFALDPGPVKLIEAWNDAGSGVARATMVFSQAGNAEAGPAALREKRALVILDAFGLAGPDAKLREFDDRISGECAAITVIYAVAQH
jgi:hypothetical protein